MRDGLCDDLFPMSTPPEFPERVAAFIPAFLVENARLNLSAARTEEAVRVHVEDSLALSQFVPFEAGLAVADIGSGGGFPALVLAAAYPDVSFTLFESVGKKAEALTRLAETLTLQNVRVVRARAEEAARDTAYRMQFGLVTARALAPLPTLLELCLPFVSNTGTFAAYKGQAFQDELTASKEALRALHATCSSIERYRLSSETEPRALLLFGRTGSLSDAYPRGVGVPEKRPLS